MGERGGRVDPLETVTLETEGAEEWRAEAEGVHGGAEVMVEAGEGEVRRAAATADGRLGLIDIDLETSLGEDDGGGESVWAGADDGGFHAGLSCVLQRLSGATL